MRRLDRLGESTRRNSRFGRRCNERRFICLRGSCASRVCIRDPRALRLVTISRLRSVGAGCGDLLVLPRFAISVSDSRILVCADILPVSVGALALLEAVFGNPAANLRLVIG